MVCRWKNLQHLHESRFLYLFLYPRFGFFLVKPHLMRVTHKLEEDLSLDMRERWLIVGEALPRRVPTVFERRHGCSLMFATNVCEKRYAELGGRIPLFRLWSHSEKLDGWGVSICNAIDNRGRSYESSTDYITSDSLQYFSSILLLHISNLE